MQNFDALLKKGFEILIGVELDEKWWRLAELPAKYGGRSLRSELKTRVAQHLCSLAKSADNVGRIVGGWDDFSVAHRDTSKWLNSARNEQVDTTKTAQEVQAQSSGWTNDNHRKDRVSEYQYSLAQLCELFEQKRVLALMSNIERLHIEANSGQHHLWVTQLPLSFKKLCANFTRVGNSDTEETNGKCFPLPKPL